MIRKFQLNSNRQGFTLIELLIVVAIIGILAAIAIPQYAKYRKGAQDNAAQSAYHAVALAEEAFFAQRNHYSTSYSSLADWGLVRDMNVNYGTLTTTSVTNTSGETTPGFAFIVNHSAPNTTIYHYNSAAKQTVSTANTGRVSTSIWTGTN